MKKISLVLLFFIFVYPTYALTEEEIFDEKEQTLSLYALSNNPTEIEKAILARPGITVHLSNAGWRLAPNISENIKNMMNKLNLNYAMTTYRIFSGPYGGIIIVYRRLENQWFIYKQSFY
jgi:hypothetical protein